MLISHSRPTIAWTLNGTGAAWLTDADALTNGRPASASRVQWSAGTLGLRGTWTDAIRPRVVALLGLTLPVGTSISLAFRRIADADYTYLADVYAETVTQLPDGSRCVWFVLPAGLDPVIGVEYRIASGSGTIDIGEAWIGPTFEVCARRTMQDHVIDPTVKRRTYGSQTFASQRLPYRSIQLELVPQKDTAIGDVRTLRGQVTQTNRVAVVPVETDVYGTALFGTAYQFDLAAMETGKYWSAVFQADEEPARPVA